MRRSRERRRCGTRVVWIELYSGDLDVLEQSGWIPSPDCDADTLSAAFCAFVNAALALPITPPEQSS
jgi:hypothetical protein